jgi:hypothetical protein
MPSGTTPTPVVIEFHPSDRYDRFQIGFVACGDGVSVAEISAFYDATAKAFCATAVFGTIDTAGRMTFPIRGAANECALEVARQPADAYTAAAFDRWLAEIADPAGQTCQFDLPRVIAAHVERKAGVAV